MRSGIVGVGMVCLSTGFAGCPSTEAVDDAAQSPDAYVESNDASIDAFPSPDSGPQVDAYTTSDAPLVPLMPREEARLSAGSARALFGTSVSLSADGSRALVGAHEDATVAGADAGSARVYVRVGETWREEAILVPREAAAGDHFGISVALSGDGSLALVGAYLDASASRLRAGSVRVFARSGTTWTEESTLLVADGASDDLFGWSVALAADGSRAVIGAHRDDTAAGSDAGSARVFLRTGTAWTEEAMLVPADGEGGDLFGYSVAVNSDGTRAIVGAYGDDTLLRRDVGSARVFTRSGSSWVEEVTLLDPDGAEEDLFGFSVAMDADGARALVGAYRDDAPGNLDAGSVRVFLRSGTIWTEEATLFARDAATGHAFGFSVSLGATGNRALVGAWAGGSARVFTRTGSVWTEEATLVGAGVGDVWFGYSVSLSADGTRALVGATQDPPSGSARVFSLK